MDELTKGEKTRAKVLKSARALVDAKGFANTSISDIIKATGVKKGNLYFHFPCKEDLGLAILKDAQREYGRFLSNSLQGRRPLEKLSNYFDALLESQKKRQFVGGCIFGNTALEMSDYNPRMSGFIKEVFDAWTGRIADILVEAQEAGDLKPALPPAALAKHIVAVIEGGIMMVRLSKNGDDLEDCLKSLRIMLGMGP